MNSVLHRELFTLAIAGALSLPLLLWPLGQWLAISPALLTGAFVWQRLWHFRTLNHPPGDTAPLATLGWANRLTVLRGWLIALCSGCLLLPSSVTAAWLAAACYSLAALLDGLDGMVARRTGRVTLLGIQLDTSMDALGLLVAPLVAVAFGKLHGLYLLAGVAYYAYQAGLYWRRRHGRPVLPLAPSRWRRPLAGLQMGVVALSLWPVVPATLSRSLGLVAMTPFLLHFFLDWLTVSARR